MTEQTKVLRLFTHQLLDCDGQPNGVHIGCDDLAMCKKSYVKGETSSAIHEWVDAAELRRLHALNGELLKALKDAAWCVQNNYMPDMCGDDWDEVIAKAEGEPK